MQMIKWKHQKPELTIAQLVAPGSNGTNSRLADAVKTYIEKNVWVKPGDKHGASYAAKRYVPILGGHVRIDEITVAHANKLVLTLVKKGLHEATSGAIRGELVNMVRWNKTGIGRTSGEPKPAAEGKGGAVKLSIRSAPAAMLGALLAPHMGGRFADFKLEVKRQIGSCAEGEIRIIEPTREMLDDAGERTSLVASINKLFESDGLKWLMKWSPVEKVFFIARISDFERAKPNKKKGA